MGGSSMSNFWTWYTSPTTGRKYWDLTLCTWVYNRLKSAGMTDNAVCGLLGNIYQESWICPYKCEGISIVTPSLDYTINTIKSATRAQFISTTDPAGKYPDGTGYSLAQWSYSRKGDYWDYNGHSDWDLVGTEYQIYRDTEFLIYDLQRWVYELSINENIWSAQGKTVWQWLTDPNVSISDAVNAVLMCYEKPFFHVPPSQSEYDTEYNLRYGYARDIMQDLAGLTPPPTPPIPPTPPTPTPTAEIPIWLLMKLKENQEQKGREYYV